MLTIYLRSENCEFLTILVNRTRANRFFLSYLFDLSEKKPNPSK